MNRDIQKPARRISRQVVFLWAVVLVGCVMFGYMALFGDRGANGNAEAAVSRLRLEDIPFNGARAYDYLKQLCALGPRRSGSPGMKAQQELLTAHFRKLGGQVELQSFRVAHPVDRSDVSMANLIVRWHPQTTERILLCAHYDTLPFPMLDPVNPRGTFVGANDGASGVAVLMELAHEMASLKGNYGVDFVLFDGEEFIFSQRDRFFLGSEYFARQYVRGRLPYRYRYGVLLDMIGDKDLQIYQERNSMWWRDTRPLVEDIWSTARRLGVREFIPRKGYTISDDHVPLHDIGKIPTCDVIDFDYPPWHTRGDTPDKCSALSLAKVGWVLREWLKAVP
ncbi:MAG: M28 family peptidase [Pirellulales bacterium]|nr:M28 family peptidase [Pirellulales bacterium]